MGLCIDISNEIKVATIKIYEATILKIKAANALQFQSSLTTLVVQWRQRNLPKNVLHFQSCPASRDFFPGCLLAYTCSKSFASPKAMPGRTFARRVVQSFSFAFFFSRSRHRCQGPKGGVPGALEPWNLCCGARSPVILLTGALILFWLWSLEPKDILRGARSRAFSSLIIRVPRLHWFLITAFLCLFVRVNGHKETESEERTVHNTSIRGYLSL